jgi:hypothetical protein
MKTRALLPAVLGAILLSAPVLAATSPATTASPHAAKGHELSVAAMSPTERCTALEHQFDDAVKTHSKSASAKSAKAMRTEGASLCASGKQAEGAQKLEQALKTLGESPKS